MVGTGILTNSGYIVQSLQSYGMLLLFWAVGGVVALLGSLAMAEMASAMPRAGGDYNFVRAGFGDGTAVVYGWGMVVVGYAAPVALISYTVANYLSALLPTSIMQAIPWQASPEFLKAMIASLVIAVFTISHCLGHAESNRVQTLSTQFKLAVFSLFLVGVFLGEKASLSHLFASLSPATGQVKLGSSFILVMYAYTGWNAAVYLAGEMQDAARDVPKALVRGTLLVTVLYVAINLFYTVAIPMDEILAADSDATGRIALMACERLFGQEGTRVISMLLSLGMLASVSAFLMTGPRILSAMASDGLSPSVLSRMHPMREIPVIAIVSVGAMSIALLWSGTFAALLDFTGFGLGVLSLLAVGVIFRLRCLSAYRPQIQTPFFPWGVGLFLVINLWMLIDAAWGDPLNAFLSLSAFGIFVPFYLWMRVHNKKSQ